MIIYDEDGQYTDEFLAYLPQLEGQIDMLIEDIADFMQHKGRKPTPLDWRIADHVLAELVSYKAQAQWIDAVFKAGTDERQATTKTE